MLAIWKRLVQNNTQVHRFLTYLVVGVSTFILDLGMYYSLIHFFGVNYLLSATLGYIIGITLNYVFSRKYVFAETERQVHTGYLIFIGIAIIGLCIITTCMYILVDLLQFNYVISRIVVAGLVGVWNFYTNSRHNFKV